MARAGVAAPGQRRAAVVAAALLGAIGLGLWAVATTAHPAPDPARRIGHIVVIYEENHSFDNLWSGWPGVDGAGGRMPAQVGQDGRRLDCLPQTDVNLTSPPRPVACTARLADRTAVPSAFPAAPFTIDDDIPAGAATCHPVSPAAPDGPGNGVRAGAGVPGGCTRDLVHKFYQEQYQLDGGRLDRYVAGSDAAGLALGRYRTTDLPLYRYLQTIGAPRRLVADRFFQAAFGGSFLNHQWLVAARTPEWPGADRSGRSDGCATGPAGCDLHSAVDANGMPGAAPLYRPSATPGVPAAGAAPPTVRDNPLAVAGDGHGGCRPSFAGAVTPPAGTACGDFAVNTIQPAAPPFAPGTPPGRRLPPLTNPTIGDRLSAAGVSWAWYGGGWANAAGDTTSAGWTNGAGPACADPQARAGSAYPRCPDTRFQFHHQPFAYFAAFGEDTPGHRANRAAHLKDEADFRAALEAGALPAVAFVKPLGTENEHPGYGSEHEGDTHLVDLVRAIQADAADWPSTVVIVTYDEFGGSADHVAPPRGAPPADRWGPGTRIPALVLSPLLPATTGVDHTTYDTTSILATIERRYHLAPLGPRDRAVADLLPLFRQR
ncbi:MAG TPA: alkaline phosphatase family protein [Acidimicrobiia bacterium]|nr:alkaline phosphatase family protein [Acidimicrobiia bacterium]